MSAAPNQETAKLMTRFLLDQLSDEERVEIEERFLHDDEYFAQLMLMEDALLDDYLLGRLGDEERRSAERLFQSSSVGKREVRFTNGLITSLQKARAARAPKKSRAVVTDKNVTQKTTTWTQSQASLNLIAAGFRGLPTIFSATAALVILLLIGATTYLIFRYQRETRELLAQQAALERNVRESEVKLNNELQNTAELGKQLDFETGLRTQAEEALAQLRSGEAKSVLSILLSPTVFERAGSSKTVTLNTDAKRLQLVLEVPSDAQYPNYNVLIKSFDGRKVWARNAIPAAQIKNNKLSLTLSSSLFPYNDYRVELNGTSESGTPQLVADYAFKVRK